MVEGWRVEELLEVRADGRPLWRSVSHLSDHREWAESRANALRAKRADRQFRVRKVYGPTAPADASPLPPTP